MTAVNGKVEVRLAYFFCSFLTCSHLPVFLITLEALRTMPSFRKSFDDGYAVNILLDWNFCTLSFPCILWHNMTYQIMTKAHRMHRKLCISRGMY